MVFTGAELITAHIKHLTSLLKRACMTTQQQQQQQYYDDDDSSCHLVAIGHILLLLSYLLLISFVFMKVGDFTFIDCLFDVFMGMTSIGISESIPRFILDEPDESKVMLLLILTFCWILFGSMVIMATVTYLVNFRVECHIRLRSKRYNVAKIDKETATSGSYGNCIDDQLDDRSKMALLVSMDTRSPQHENDAVGVKRKPKMSVANHSNCTHI